MSKRWGASRKGGDIDPPSTVRGKISAPIPIPTDDDEFPDRNAVGLAIPFGYDRVEATAEDGQGTVHSQTQTSITRTPPRKISPQRFSGDELRRSTTGSRFRESGLLSPLTSPAKPERRKRSFRAALGRLFGKKPKGDGSLANGQAKGRASHKHHKSDPSALSIAPDKQISPQRSNSLPLNQINRGLASHPTLSNGDPLDNGQLDSSPTRPRRATIPSRLFSNAPAMYTDFSGLSPRPTSHGREGAASRIGQAITSGAHPNRRSKSAGQLKTLAGFTAPFPKRRSEEIRQWRGSFDPSGPLSPWSSQRPDTAVTAQSQPDPSQQDEEAIPGLAIDDELSEMPSRDPEPEPFNFGPIGPMAMAGMTITQAANLEDRVLYLEARLREMEHVLFSWGQGPHANEQNTAADPDRLQPPIPPKHASRPFSAEFGSGSETLTGRGPHSRDGTPRPVTPTREPRSRSTTDTTDPPDGPGDPSPLQRSQMQDCSPTSKYSTPESNGAQIATPTPASMRGFPSFSVMPLSKHGSLTAHHYSALLNLIQVERKAREEVEEKVGLLERR
ncbi:hypothetical protein O988_08692, partial [Pseudogymnoascus sp. VKM F-3808]